MLIRPADDATDDEGRWRAFVAAQGFGHLVAAGRGRDVPVVVPTQFLLDGNRVLCHLAAANPVFACLEENPTAVMSVAGDWAYIPTHWKAIGDEDPRRGIPTTYYAAVQLIGEVTVHHRPEDVADVLRHQLGDLEPSGDHVDPLEHGPVLRGIRGIELAVRRVRAKFKYGGNVDAEHRANVAAELRRRSAPGDGAALAHVVER